MKKRATLKIALIDHRRDVMNGAPCCQIYFQVELFSFILSSRYLEPWSKCHQDTKIFK